jgi:hypothetical protein
MVTNKLPSKEDMEARLAQLTAPTERDGEVLEQMRLLVQVCRLNDPRPRRQRVVRPHTSKTARLHLFLGNGLTLTPSQRQKILQEIQTVNDDVLRLPLLARLAPQLPVEKRREVAYQIWRGLLGVGLAYERAQLIFQLATLVDTLSQSPSSAVVSILGHAREIEDRPARVRALIALSQHFPAELKATIQSEALRDIEQLSGDAARCSALTTLADVLLPERVDQALACAFQIEAPEERVRALTALARTMPSDVAQRIQMQALDAIETIMGEEPRVEALIAFSPYLDYAQEADDEFPAILERALGIAIGMTRRQFRARALVALAPHLPRELKGEAIAAVNKLESEHERAALLQNLAPHLPPNMLVASLAVVHTMQAQDARVYALTTLARYVPEKARQQTVADALAATEVLPHHFERVTALLELLDVLPESLQERAYIQALDAAGQIKNQNTRARALTMISDRFPPELLERALDVANTLEDPQRRMTALAALASRLPDERRPAVFGHILSIVEEIRYEYRQARALVTIAPKLPPDMIAHAVEIARGIEDPYDRVSALIALTQNIAPEQRFELVAESWKLLHHVDGGYDRAMALAALAPLLPPKAEADLTRAISQAIGAISDSYDRASAIILLVPLLAMEKVEQKPKLPNSAMILRDGFRVAMQVSGQQDRAQLLLEGVACWLAGFDVDDRATQHAIWGDLMPLLGSLPLADAMLCVEALIPIIRRLSGEAGVREMLIAFGLPE